MRDFLSLYEEFRLNVGPRRAAVYQNQEKARRQSKEASYSNVSFPGIKNLWDIIAMVRLFVMEVAEPRVGKCWFDPEWDISLLREIGIEFVTVIDWRDEEITNAEKEFPGQVYELIKAHPVKDELQIAHKLDALIVHTILQHLNDEQLNLFLANMRRIVKDGAVMILIFKSMPKKGSLRNYLDRIGQKKARINDVATGDVTIWEEKLGSWRDLHLWAPDQVLKIAKNNGWTLIKETLQTPAKITFRSDSRKMEHCVYFLKAVPIEEGGN